MKVAVLGASGRTGRLVVRALHRRGHTVTALVRRADAAPPEADDVVVGSATDADAVGRLVAGADAVVSALGPSGDDPELHRRAAAVLLPALAAAGVRRYVAVGGAGMDVEGDRKRARDRVITALMRRVAGGVVRDKEAELAALRAAGVDWTVVRPPRLNDRPATGRVEHDAHRSTASTSMSRADLAEFLVDVLERGDYVGRAPFAATARR